MRKRLGCLIIGDEILAGHVHESNSHWLAKECKAIGVELVRIEICTDEVPDIIASVRRFFHELDLDYIITSGGLGPTPDDRTMEGIAKAIGVELTVEPQFHDMMKARIEKAFTAGRISFQKPNDGHMKMAHLPAGSEPMPNEVGTCLGAIVSHNNRLLFTLPGVPSEFMSMFRASILQRLEHGDIPHVKELILYSEESRFFPVLRDLEIAHPDVVIGSYPQMGHILIRATGPKASAAAVIAAMREAGAQYLQPKVPG